MTQEDYRAILFCWNCKAKNVLIIEKGIPVKDFIEKTEKKCFNCGCKLKLKGGKDDEKE